MNHYGNFDAIEKPTQHRFGLAGERTLFIILLGVVVNVCRSIV
jgi:hypothetical protein